MNHTHIYHLSTTAVAVSEYSLNFLWVNLNPQDRSKDIAQNIFKHGLDLSENAECIKDPDTLRKLEGSEQSQAKRVSKEVYSAVLSFFSKTISMNKIQ